MCCGWVRSKGLRGLWPPHLSPSVLSLVSTHWSAQPGQAQQSTQECPKTARSTAHAPAWLRLRRRVSGSRFLLGQAVPGTHFYRIPPPNLLSCLSQLESRHLVLFYCNNPRQVSLPPPSFIIADIINHDDINQFAVENSVFAIAFARHRRFSDPTNSTTTENSPPTGTLELQSRSWNLASLWTEEIRKTCRNQCRQAPSRAA